LIKVNDKYVIKSLPIGYGAYEVTGKTHFDSKLKREVADDNLIGYYTTVSASVKGIRDWEAHKFIAENNLSLHEAINKLEEINKYFASLVLEEEVL